MMMKKKEYISGTMAVKTDTGKVRLTNEDRAVALVNARGNVLLAVCDGMGGQNKGEYAAEIAINTIAEAFKKKPKFFSFATAMRWIYSVVRKANNEIYDEASKNINYNGMGTTLTIALIVDGHLIVGQIGDSRCYALVDRKLKQFSEDQTYVGYLYRTGKITKEEMKTHPKRHVLMNALGIFPSVNIDVKTFPYNSETLLVCSDGLYNNVPDSEIGNILRSTDSTEQKVNELISLGNANGGSDNIAVVLWEAQK